VTTRINVTVTFAARLAKLNDESRIRPVSTLARSRRQFGVLASVAVVVALVTGGWMVAEGSLARAADAGVQQGMAARSGADRGLRMTAELGADPQAQNTQVRAALERSFAALATPPEVFRTVSAAASVTTPAEPNTTRAGLVMVIDDLEQQAELLAGTWAASPGDVTVQADAAELLEVQVGDVLTLDGTPARIAGLWRVTDPLDARWLGDPQVLAGHDNAGPSSIGPIVVDEARMTSFEQPDAQWTVVPDATRITAADLTTIATTWAQLPAAWRGEVDDAGSFHKSGRLRNTVADLDARVDGLRAIEPVVVLLLAAAALVALLELGRLLASNRAREIALLWARGRGSTETGAWAGVEASIAAAIGAVAGLGAGALALALLGDRVTLSPSTLGVALVAVLTAIAACGTAAARQAREGVRAEAAENRLRRAAGPTATIIALAAAGVSVWQLQLYGTPVTPLADGTSAVDPIAVVAPALAVVAGALLALTAFPLLARLVMRATVQAPAPRMLAAHSVARRLRRVTAPLLVIAIAGSTVLVAAGYTATWSQAFDRTSALRAGAPLSVVGAGSFDAPALDRLASVAGVDALVPVRRDELVLSDGTGTAVAVAPDAFAALADDAAGTIDPAAIAEQFRAEPVGPAIPAAARELVLTANLDGFSAAPAVRLRYTDGWGRERVLTTEASASASDGAPDGEVRFTATLPATAASTDGRLLAVDVEVLARSIASDAATFTLATLGTDAGELSDAFGRDAWKSEAASITAAIGPTGPLGFRVSGGGATVRMTPPPAQGMPPVLVTRTLADRYGLDVGSTFSVQTAGSYASVNMRIAGVLPAVPGADDSLAALIDLGILQSTAARETRASAVPNALWLDSAEVATTATALRAALPPGTRILTAEDAAGRAVVGSAAIALVGVAALCILLALITLAAVSRADHRLRLGDLAVLRARGFRSTQQAAVRRGEWWIVAASGLLAGAIIGTLVVLLTIPQLTSAALPEPIPGLSATVRIDPLLTIGGAVVLLGAIVLLGEFAAARVRRDALRALGGEEQR
jgi:hypothetical protein